MQASGTSKQALSRDDKADDLSQQLSSLNLASPAAPAALHVLIQEDCYKHTFERTTEDGSAVDDSDIVERAERLDAVKAGISAAYTRLSTTPTFPSSFSYDNHTALVLDGSPFDIRYCKTSLPLTHDSVRYIHNRSNLSPLDVESSFAESLYPDQLASWIGKSASALATHTSEIPAHLPQGDLYLSPGSREAIEGSIGCVCQAVEEVCETDGIRFCVVRPPGHVSILSSVKMRHLLIHWFGM